MDVIKLDGNMYNILHGQQPDAAVLIRMLELDNTVGLRLRDAWLNPDGTKIIVLTRNGGGNRGHTADAYARGPSCPCVGCAITFVLPQLHPDYIRDWDDDYDSTYAYVEFKVRVGYEDWCKQLATGQEMPTLKQRSDAVIAQMQQMSPAEIKRDARFSKVIDAVEKLARHGEHE
jgi:hypothetical protein